MALSPELADIAASLLGSAVVAARPVPGGYTPALRRRLELADGRTVFLKAALDPDIATRLRREGDVYSHQVAPFMPRVLAWNDDPPLLVLEDLSQCTWVPPWTTAMVSEVLRTLNEIANREPFAGLEKLGELFDDPSRSTHQLALGWSDVQQDYSPFLSRPLL